MTAVSDLARRYVDERAHRHELAPSSVPMYRSRLGNFALTIDDPPITELGVEHVDYWLTTLDVGPSTMSGTVSTIRTFSRWAVMHGFLEEDPTRFIGKMRKAEPVPRWLAPEEVAAVVAAAGDVRQLLMTMLMYNEALRCCEVARIEIGDIKVDEQLLVVHGKGGYERVLPVSEETWSVLRRHRADQPARTGPLVHYYADHRRPLSPQYISGRMGEQFVDAGVDESAHSLRHTCATEMIRGGANIRAVQAFLGHRSLSTTQIYLGYDVTDLRKATAAGRAYRREGRAT